jgi:hypothetical protein
MCRMGCDDRWKLRYAEIPRLRLGNNGKPRSTKISSLILVLVGSHFSSDPTEPLSSVSA